MIRTRSGHWVLLLLCWGYCALALVGCELFRKSPAELSNAESKLPGLKIPPDSMELEVLVVERPVGDRLLGDFLWKEVDTNLNMEPGEQRDLQRNGFQVGVAGAHPPVALQQLLEMRAKPIEGEIATVQDDDQRLHGSRFYRRSGEEVEIQINDTPHVGLKFNLFANHGSKDPTVKEFVDARCKYRVTVKREQRGWARLDFIPEVHYGVDQLRPAPGANDWELKSQSNIDKLLPQRFTVILNTGDMVLVTGNPTASGTVGHRFFTGPEGQDGVQRMLIIRLAHMAAGDQPYEMASSRGIEF